MRISREAKVLLSLMIAAAAVLIWVNYFTQRQLGGSLLGNGGSGNSVVSQPTENAADVPLSDAASSSIPVVPTENAADVATTEAATVDEATTDTATETVTDAVPAVTDAEAAAQPVVDAATAPVEIVVPEVAVPEATTQEDTVEATVPDVADSTDVTVPSEAAVEAALPTAPAIPEATVLAAPITTAARDVEIVTLPFLITAPPLLEDGDLAEEEGSGVISQAGGRRASVNPFSPILLQEVEVVSQPVPGNVPPVEVVNVPAEAPQAAPPIEVLVEPEPVPAPSPATAAPLRTFTPPTPVATNLPRPLPSGTLPTTPAILRVAQRSPSISDASPVEAVPLANASVRVPAAPSVTPPLAVGGTATAEEAVPEVLGVGAAAEAVTEPLPSSCGPLAAGACSLSQYLRDTNVRFTGYVIGPVGVGVFRADGTTTPVVLPIGQSLPDTDIVLTSLEGKQAEFSQGDDKQFLTLDFWR